MSQVSHYAVIDAEHPRESPLGIVRRTVVDGVEEDEAFTRSLLWEPTDYLRLYFLGHNEEDHVEITEDEAAAFTVGVILQQDQEH